MLIARAPMRFSFEGDGFLLLYCREQAQEAVTRALEERGLKRMNFRFDQQGAIVVLNVASFNPRWVAPYAEPEAQEPTVHPHRSVSTL